MKKCSIMVPMVLCLLCLAACGGGNDNAASSSSSTPKPTPTPSPTPTTVSYLRTDDGNVRFLKWTVGTGGSLTGLWSAATVQNNAPVYQNGTLTGTINGDNLTLTMSLGGQSQSATGTLSNGVLTLQEAGDNGQLQSVVYQPCSTDQYTQAVNTFKAAHPS
jgi:hypothetical protein